MESIPHTTEKEGWLQYYENKLVFVCSIKQAYMLIFLNTWDLSNPHVGLTLDLCEFPGPKRYYVGEIETDKFIPDIRYWATFRKTSYKYEWVDYWDVKIWLIIKTADYASLRKELGLDER